MNGFSFSNLIVLYTFKGAVNLGFWWRLFNLGNAVFEGVGTLTNSIPFREEYTVTVIRSLHTLHVKKNSKKS